MDSKGPDKKQRLLAALDQGMVMIHLDARRPGVLVPVHLREESHLRLNLSYRFDPPDLIVGEWGVRCTLRFSGQRASVAVPWSALFAITSHVSKEFWMYPDDMPPEVIHQGMASAPRREAPQAALDGPSGKPAGGILREVVLEPYDGGAEAEAAASPPPEDSDPKPDPEGPKPKGRGHLRIVK